MKKILIVLFLGFNGYSTPEIGDTYYYSWRMNYPNEPKVQKSEIKITSIFFDDNGALKVQVNRKDTMVYSEDSTIINLKKDTLNALKYTDISW